MLALITLCVLPQGSIQDLGLAPNGLPPRALDADATCSALTVMAGGDAYLWEDGIGYTPIVAPPAYAGQPIHVGAISGNGQVVGGTLRLSLFPATSFRWTRASGFEFLEDPPFFSYLAQVVGMSFDGSIVGANTDFSSLNMTPAFWDASGAVSPFPHASGPPLAALRDVSDTLGVAVGDLLGGAPAHFRYVPGSTPVPLISPADATTIANAQAISDDGRVVAGARRRAIGGFSRTRLVRWNAAGQFEFLEGPAFTTTTLEVLDMDRSGRAMVGTMARTTAFHWSEAGGYQSIPTLAQAHGVAFPGAPTEAESISRDGNVIVCNMGPSSAPAGVLLLRLSPDAPTPRGSASCSPGQPNSTGTSAVLEAVGSDRVASRDLDLEVDLLPMHVAGIFLASRQAGFVPLAGGSEGTLCLGGGVSRFVRPGEVRSSGLLGRTALRLDFDSIPEGSGSVAVAPGDTWHFQFWYRDRRAGVSTSNLTNGWVVTFR